MKPIILVLPSLFILSCFTKTAEEWKNRVLYQIVTDRFSKSDGDTAPCNDLSKYCGGTFKGIERNLDYIQGMGIDAIWISPVTANSPGNYHGYAYTNFYEINENFGTEQDFKDLVQACHNRGMWIMVDVVPNHVAIVPNDSDFSSIYPFDNEEFYHWPIIKCKDIDDYDPTNQTALESCWLWGLPDLNHEHPFVRQTLLDWIRDFVQKYQIDALRIDAVRHVPKWFWHEFSQAAGVFTIGEVFNIDTSYNAAYQGPIDSLLNFPFHNKLSYVFHKGGTMTSISHYYKEALSVWNDIGVLGNFIGNHDLPRFLHNNDDVPGFKAALAFVMCSTGIPVVYYGDEQSFSGGDDPQNREALWTSLNTDSEIYTFLKTILIFRQQTKFYEAEQVERLFDDKFYAFSRGNYFFAFTNSLEVQTRTISSHSYKEDTVLCNLFDGKDCAEVKNGEFQVSLMNKEVKILFPKESNEEGEKTSTKIWNDVKSALGVASLSKTSDL